MAWIESHQTLRGHPKVRKAARQLGIGHAQLIGHLHLLWWWTLDHAFDGDLSRFDLEDLADAADWSDDPGAFVDALVECGPGESHGFLERSADRLVVHDWGAYTEHLRRRREASMAANHQRWHVERSRPDPACPLCSPNGVRTESEQESTGTGTGTYQTQPTHPARARARGASAAVPLSAGELEAARNEAAQRTHGRPYRALSLHQRNVIDDEVAAAQEAS